MSRGSPERCNGPIRLGTPCGIRYNWALQAGGQRGSNVGSGETIYLTAPEGNVRYSAPDRMLLGLLSSPLLTLRFYTAQRSIANHSTAAASDVAGNCSIHRSLF